MDSYFQTTRDPVMKQLFESNLKKNFQPSVDEAVEAVKTG